MRLKGLLIFASICFLQMAAAHAADVLTTKVGLIRAPHIKETISILDIPPDDDALAGAKLALEDNNTTGRFLNQTYTIEDIRLKAEDDPVAAFNQLVANGATLILADLPAQKLLQIADAARGKDVLIFNISAPDDSLREENCRRNVIHVAPTHSMRADGLAQYLVWKQWRRWFLIGGSHPQDQLLTDAYRRAAKKFGAKIVEERTYQDTGGGRRSDSGSVQTQKLVPVQTQNAPAYDVLIAADESEVFAGYLPYHNWDARPVAGSAGLKPVAWDGSHEQWGAVQLQNRFFKLNSRRMNERDYDAWLATRMIGEAVTRTKANDANAARDYLVGPDFSIAAFMGQKLTMRTWNQQMRQPILLGDGRMIASVSPQEGFLHQTSQLDTLGYDRPETKCKLQ
jgi:ABC transporter substrate binding protein (PQQ-dependent alcohol dehydrogenase system)